MYAIYTCSVTQIATCDQGYLSVSCPKRFTLLLGTVGSRKKLRKKK